MVFTLWLFVFHVFILRRRLYFLSFYLLGVIRGLAPLRDAFSLSGLCLFKFFVFFFVFLGDYKGALPFIVFVMNIAVNYKI